MSLSPFSMIQETYLIVLQTKKKVIETTIVENRHVHAGSYTTQISLKPVQTYRFFKPVHPKPVSMAIYTNWSELVARFLNRIGS